MKKVETISINKQQSYIRTLQSIILLFIGGAIFSAATGSNDLEQVGLWGIVAYIAAIIIHELLHGVGFLLAGARQKFGVGVAGFLPIAYATSNSKVRVLNMLLVGYLPLVKSHPKCDFSVTFASSSVAVSGSSD